MPGRGRLPRRLALRAGHRAGAPGEGPRPRRRPAGRWCWSRTSSTPGSPSTTCSASCAPPARVAGGLRPCSTSRPGASCPSRSTTSGSRCPTSSSSATGSTSPGGTATSTGSGAPTASRPWPPSPTCMCSSCTRPDRSTARPVGWPSVVEMELVGVRVELPTSTPIVLLRERSGDQPRAADLHRRARGHGHRLRPRGGHHAPADDPRPDEGPARRPGRERRVASSSPTCGTAPSSPRSSCTPATASTGCPAARPTPSPWPPAPARRSTPTRRCSTRPATRAEEDDEDDGEPAEEVVEQFKEFIDTVNPEDFAS